MDELHIEPILHLSALALIVAIAYLGLDRVHQEQDEFLAALKRAQNEAHTFVVLCNVGVDGASGQQSMFHLFPFFVRLKFFVLCQIAGLGHVKMGWAYRGCHWCHRLRHVPLLGYFRDRRDRKWVSLFAAILLLIFLYMTAAAMWHLGYFPSDLWWATRWIEMYHLLTPAYWVCLVTLVWIFVTVGTTHLLLRIELVAKSLQHDVGEHMRVASENYITMRTQGASNGGSGAVDQTTAAASTTAVLPAADAPPPAAAPGGSRL